MSCKVSVNYSTTKVAVEMVKVPDSEHDITHEAMTRENGIEGVGSRAMNFFGLTRNERSGSEESPSEHYDICGRVSAEGLEKLVVALQDVEVLRDDLQLKWRPHDPYDPHSAKLNAWTDLLA